MMTWRLASPRSASRTMTLFPDFARVSDRFVEKLVFPTPPLPLVTATTRARGEGGSDRLEGKSPPAKVRRASTAANVVVGALSFRKVARSAGMAGTRGTERE